MNTRRKCLLVLMTVVLVGVLLCADGCKKTEAKGSVELCVKCGQIKGDESCCKADADKCVMCGLAEESPADGALVSLEVTLVRIDVSASLA